jgi:hypothetical protein
MCRGLKLARELLVQEHAKEVASVHASIDRRKSRWQGSTTFFSPTTDTPASLDVPPIMSAAVNLNQSSCIVIGNQRQRKRTNTSDGASALHQPERRIVCAPDITIAHKYGAPLCTDVYVSNTGKTKLRCKRVRRRLNALTSMLTSRFDQGVSHRARCSSCANRRRGELALPCAGLQTPCRPRSSNWWQDESGHVCIPGEEGTNRACNCKLAIAASHCFMHAAPCTDSPCGNRHGNFARGGPAGLHCSSFHTLARVFDALAVRT